jgi:hypothetical protein
LFLNYYLTKKRAERDIIKIPSDHPIAVEYCYKAYSIQRDKTAENLMAKKQKGNHTTEDTAIC